MSQVAPVVRCLRMSTTELVRLLTHLTLPAACVAGFIVLAYLKQPIQTLVAASVQPDISLA